MTPLFDSFARWLADYYLLSGALLVLAVVALVIVKQPANRRAITQSTLIGLLMLAALCAIPGWSLLNLTSARPTVAMDASPAASRNDFEYVGALAIATEPQPVAGDMLPAPGAQNSDHPPIARTPSHEIPWPSIAVIAWTAGALCALAWHAIGMWAAIRMISEAQPAPALYLTMLRDLEHSTRRRPTKLLTSPRIDVAVVLGVWRSAVLLPTDWLQTQSSEDLRTVLAHEAAHLHNHDLKWLALSRILTVLLWANPLFWFIRRRMRLDQEALADATAAELTTRQQYAEQLVAWAREMSSHPKMRLSSAVGLWESPSPLRSRIALLLDEHFTMLRQCARRWKFATLAFSSFAALGLSLVTLEPKLEAHEEPITAEQNSARDSSAGATSPTESQTADDATPRDLAKPIPNTIQGRLIDEARQPVAGAEVSLLRVNHNDASHRKLAQTTTDADGRYRFDNVIEIAKEFQGGEIPSLDFLPSEYVQVALRFPGRVSDAWLDLPQRVARYGVFQQTVLPKAATLRGRVTGPDGNPVEGALVTCGSHALDRLEGANSDHTDANGDYEIDDVAPFDIAEYLKQQEQDQRRMQERTRHGADFVLFRAPPMLSVDHPNFAVKKTSYESIPGDKDVQLEPPAAFEGRVIDDETGKPAAGALVTVATSRTSDTLPRENEIYSHHRAAVRTDADGKYRFTNLPAGVYDIWAASPARVNEGEIGTAAETNEVSTIPDLTLVVGTPVTISLIETKSGKPLKVPAGTQAMVGAHPIRHRTMSRPDGTQTSTANADGKFEVRTLPGKNRLWVGIIDLDGETKWVGSQPVEIDVDESQPANADVPVVSMADAQTSATFSMMTASPPTPHQLEARLKSLSASLAENPNEPDVLLARAGTLQALGQYAKAVADYERLIELNLPRHMSVMASNNLAYILSTAPDAKIRDGKRAVALAGKAAELSPSIADVFDTLAAAYAELGDFEKAIESQQKAIKLRPETKTFREHLKLYQDKKPLRDDHGRSQDHNDGDDDEKKQSKSDPAVEPGSQFLRDLRANAAPLLAAMATKHGYGLEPLKDLVRVPPPFAAIRMDYYRTAHPGQADAIRRGPEAMVFRWVDDRLLNWGMSFGDPDNPGYSITSVVDALADIHSQNIDGPDDLLRKNVPGDWVVRPGVDKARIIAQLQQIIQDELSLPISLELRDVKRRVYVARGQYQLTPLPGQRGQDKQTLADETFTTDEIQVFGKQLVPNSGAGGGVGDFDEFLNWLGRWVGASIVSDVETLPANKLSWHLHERSPSTEQTREEDHDPKLVLPNITAQTGLEFALEVRPIEILFVETAPATNERPAPQP